MMNCGAMQHSLEHSENGSLNVVMVTTDQEKVRKTIFFKVREKSGNISIDQRNLKVIPKSENFIIRLT